ncbi:MAG: hypothetical protein LKKZDAJK_002165 [Candidatus Fervidibacter sp.]
MAETRLKATKEDFKKLPEGPPYYEFERGEVIELPRPHPWHNFVVYLLASFLWSFVRPRNLGLVFMDSEVELPTGVIYAPDILFIAIQNAAIYNPQTGEIIGVPDLVVEVLSPAHQERDRIRKFAEYEAAKVPWLWLVDPFALTIEEYQHTGEHYLRVAGVGKGETFRPKLFPELEINLLTLVGEPPK